MLFYFGKNAGSISHIDLLCDICVATSGAMRFSCAGRLLMVSALFNCVLTKYAKRIVCMKYSDIGIDKKKIYEVAIIANTSSGKSTLINAIVGRKILVSKNRPCTSRNIKIFDNDNVKGTIAHVLYEDGTYLKIDDYSMDIVNEYNSACSGGIKDLILECDFAGIANLKKSVVIIDTPGPNNSLDEGHAKETEKCLESLESGLMLYVINASQPCTYDDEMLLKQILKKQKYNGKIKTVFVLNKIDEVDIEKENPMEVVQNCFEYLKNLGFRDINLVSVSARAALIFKQVLSGIDLNSDEKRRFDDLYNTFAVEGYNYNELSVFSDKISSTRKISVKGIEYTEAGIKAAIDNTGITQLVKLIEANLIETLKYNPIKIKKINHYKEQQK